jgi:translation initiation factor IF-1
MAKDDLMELSGTVEEFLPSATVRVRLDNDHDEFSNRLLGKMRKNRIRVLIGDQVTVEMTAYDLTRGRIIYRFK